VADKGPPTLGIQYSEHGVDSHFDRCPMMGDSRAMRTCYGDIQPTHLDSFDLKQGTSLGQHSFQLVYVLEKVRVAKSRERQSLEFTLIHGRDEVVFPAAFNDGHHFPADFILIDSPAMIRAQPCFLKQNDKRVGCMRASCLDVFDIFLRDILHDVTEHSLKQLVGIFDILSATLESAHHHTVNFKS
jgi:hypothetical protein